MRDKLWYIQTGILLFNAKKFTTINYEKRNVAEREAVNEGKHSVGHNWVNIYKL